MMSSPLLFVALIGGMGVFCLAFTDKAAKFLSIFAQLNERSRGNQIDPAQSWARPMFIRLMGLAQVGMAAFVYFSKVSS